MLPSKWSRKYRAFTDKFESNRHVSAVRWNCTTHFQAPQGFPDEDPGPETEISPFQWAQQTRHLNLKIGAGLASETQWSHFRILNDG